MDPPQQHCCFNAFSSQMHQKHQLPPEAQVLPGLPSSLMLLCPDDPDLTWAQSVWGNAQHVTSTMWTPASNRMSKCLWKLCAMRQMNRFSGICFSEFKIHRAKPFGENNYILTSRNAQWHKASLLTCGDQRIDHTTCNHLKPPTRGALNCYTICISMLYPVFIFSPKF